MLLLLLLLKVAAAVAEVLLATPPPSTGILLPLLPPLLSWATDADVGWAVEVPCKPRLLDVVPIAGGAVVTRNVPLPPLAVTEE